MPAPVSSQPRLNTFQPITTNPQSLNPQIRKPPQSLNTMHMEQPVSVGVKTPVRSLADNPAKQAYFSGGNNLTSNRVQASPKLEPRVQQAQVSHTKIQQKPPAQSSSRNTAVASKGTVKIFDDDNEGSSVSGTYKSNNIMNAPGTPSIRRSDFSMPETFEYSPMQVKQASKHGFSDQLPKSVSKSPVSEQRAFQYDKPPVVPLFDKFDGSKSPTLGGQTPKNEAINTPTNSNRPPQHSRDAEIQSQLRRLDNEYASLKAQQASKEKELRELTALQQGIQTQGPNNILSQCIQLSKKIKNQESELRDLRLDYNILKEETEKQRFDLMRLEGEDELERVPRSKEELVSQNQKLTEKITLMNREFEKKLYDKTLEVEKKARAKMHKIAMRIALKHIETRDPDLDYLISNIEELEKENERLERENPSTEASFVN